jgi:hypothetical protein
MSIANQELLHTETLEKLVQSYIVSDEKTGLHTTVHVAKYDRSHYLPQLAIFEEEMHLPGWCQRQNVQEAIVGGFFVRQACKPLGDIWSNGIKVASTHFDNPWHTRRGSLHILGDTIQIDYRHLLPEKPSGDLLQAGPLLVKERKPSLSMITDFEGFKRGAHQFDSDITAERHPRAALGINKTHIFSVVCDGRADQDTGMYLEELAKFMADELQCTEALNLDGGGSASLVSEGQLINKPRGDNCSYLVGRPIYNAIVFEAIARV